MYRAKTALISVLSALVISPLAVAVDPGTYRPGQPYAATPATSHTACDAQCKGDAACKGWNYVKADPRQKGGICEFNALAVDPIQSRISVSANQSYIINSTGQSRIIPAGVRTTRIGAPQPSQAAIKTTRKNAASAKTQSQRRVIRQAPPRRAAPQAAAYRHNLGAAPQRLNRPQAPQTQGRRSNINRPAARPSTQRTPQITRTTNGLPPRAQGNYQPQLQPQLQPQSQNAPAQRGPADPRLQQRFSGAQQAPRPAFNQQPASAQDFRQASGRIYGQEQRQDPRQAPRQLSAQASAPQAALRPRPQQRGGLLRALTGETPQARNIQQPQQQPRRPFSLPPQAQPISAEDASQRSLYGHLNDDVSVPRFLSLEDLAIPNDQPIPTVTSVPVKPVDREAFSDLAGGR